MISAIGGALLFTKAMLVVKVVAMPEPSAIPELLACLGGIGYFAWRSYRKRQ